MLKMMLSQATSYFIVFLFTFMFVLVDTGLHYFGRYMNERTHLKFKLAKIR